MELWGNHHMHLTNKRNYGSFIRTNPSDFSNSVWDMADFKDLNDRSDPADGAIST